MRIGTASNAAALLEPIFAAASGELIAVVHLDRLQQLIAITFEGRGTPDEVELPIGAILARALRLGTDALIVGHNHPSGDPTPSAADIDSTRRLAEALAAVDLKLFDHLIFGGGDCRSFRALGLI